MSGETNFRLIEQHWFGRWDGVVPNNPRFAARRVIGGVLERRAPARLRPVRRCSPAMLERAVGGGGVLFPITTTHTATRA